jgi:DNA-binding response OmpR family regulator
MEVKTLTRYKPRILIVEDDPSISQTLSLILKQEGYDVDIAENGQRAILMSNAKFYNLALLDIKLPDMEGTKLLTEMQTNVPKTIRIIVTGYPSLENAIEALNEGADGYVRKPVKPERLLSLIKEKLTEQGKTEKMTQEQVTEWIKTRARQLEPT